MQLKVCLELYGINLRGWAAAYNILVSPKTKQNTLHDVEFLEFVIAPLETNMEQQISYHIVLIQQLLLV